MRDFMTDSSFKITNDRQVAAFLFEHIESYASGHRIQVQKKNEDGLWGGRGDDVNFTLHVKSLTKTRAIKGYADLERQDEIDAEDEARHGYLTQFRGPE